VPSTRYAFTMGLGESLVVASKDQLKNFSGCDSRASTPLATFAGALAVGRGRQTRVTTADSRRPPLPARHPRHDQQRQTRGSSDGNPAENGGSCKATSMEYPMTRFVVWGGASFSRAIQPTLPSRGYPALVTSSHFEILGEQAVKNDARGASPGLIGFHRTWASRAQVRVAKSYALPLRAGGGPFHKALSICPSKLSSAAGLLPEPDRPGAFQVPHRHVPKRNGGLSNELPDMPDPCMASTLATHQHALVGCGACRRRRVHPQITTSQDPVGGKGHVGCRADSLVGSFPAAQHVGG
jgi:hypothetical protein